MQGDIRFGLAQINPVTGDIRNNTEKIIASIKKAQDEHVDILIFPETAITGYSTSDLIEHEGFVFENKQALEKIIKHCEGIVVLIGFIDYDPGKKNEDGRLRKYNSAAVVQDRELVGTVRKTLLPNYRYFDDRRYYTPAEARKTTEVDIKGRKIKLGVSICEDMWDDSYAIKPVDELAGLGAEIIININASPFAPGKLKLRIKKIQEHIQKHKIPFIYLNKVGASDNGKNIIPFDGESLFFDRAGNLLAKAKKHEEDFVIVEHDIARPENRGLEPRTRSREQEIFDCIVASLRDYAQKTGFTRATVPVSGGVDSALGLVLTSEAFGKSNVRAFNLPSRFNTKATKDIARKLSENLGVEYCIIPIQELNDKITEVFEDNAHKIEKPITLQNIQARIRGLLMMIESNDSGTLLISNGNETEIALGYATLYGDMCGGISLIGDLSKTDVYALGEYINKRFGKEVIPEEIFGIAPSAELDSGQVDPFDYTVVAPMVSEIAEKRTSTDELIERFSNKTLDKSLFRPDKQGKTVYDKMTLDEFRDELARIQRLIRRSVYKRLQGPPIIAVTDRAFGFDLRETIINHWYG
jgi:NAD+ synthase (glutamine-hydrolysing)